MKKKLQLALLFSLFVTFFGLNGVQSQVIFSETFDNGMPGTFTLINVDNRTPAANVAYVNDAWIVREDFIILPPDSVAYSTSWYSPAGAADDWMITPQISLTTNNILSWYEFTPDVNFRDGYQVLISTTTPTTAAFTALLTVPEADTLWNQRTIDLQAAGYANQTVYIAFRNNSNDKFLLMIDDIEVYESNAVCGQDTVDYALAKSTGIPGISINNATSAPALSMYFDAPQAIDISGFSFLARKSDTTGGSEFINVWAELFLAGTDSTPTGSPLASTRVTLDTNLFGGNLAQLEKHAFWPAVSVSVPYVLVVRNSTPTPITIFCNDWGATPADGGQEWLSSVFLGGSWLRGYNVNVGGVPFDADPIFAPHVSYDITADFTPLVSSGAIGVPNTWTDNSSPILNNRMYNINAFNGSASSSWNWDYGDLSPIDNVVNGNHTYAANGLYSVTLTDSMLGWRMLCSDTQTGSIQIGTPPAGCTGSCGPDTVDYALAKSTGLPGVNINSATSAQAVSQYFNTPQPITVSGITFPCWKPDPTGGASITITCELYAAGIDSMPSGSPLATGTVLVDTNFFGGNITALEKHVSWTPVTMSVPYVVVMKNLSANSVTILTNDYNTVPPDGQQEWLSSVDLFGTWTRSYAVIVGGVPFDADWIVSPHVCFDLQADFVPNSVTDVVGTPISWLNGSSPVLQDRMYNQAAFIGQPQLSYSWDFGDGTQQDTTINGNHTYTGNGVFTVTHTDSLFGWRTLCTDDTTGTATITGGGPCSVNNLTLGTASNAFTQILSESNQVIANNDLNSVLFIHRNNTAIFGGHSGQLRYDISTNGGASWTTDLGILNPLSVNGTNPARYPQISLYNPTGNTNPNNAYLVYQAATFGGTNWNGIVTGVRRLNGTGNTENYNQAIGTNTLIPRSQVEGAPGTYWAVDGIWNGTNITGYRVLKGTWNGTTDVAWAVNNTLTPAFNTLFDSTAKTSDFVIGFDPSGTEGWICILTHVTPGPSDFAFYPVFYHSTDAGATWTGPETVDLGAYSCITSNITPGNVPTTAFDVDLTVDVNGNPHALVEICNGPGTYSVFPGEWRAMFDITRENGMWVPIEVGQRSAFRGNWGTAPNVVDMDAHCQASRTADGTRIFLNWTDTDTTGIGTTDNQSPNLFGRAYNVATRNWNTLQDFTSCNFSIAGNILFPKMAPVVLGTTGSYRIPAAFLELDINNDPINPITSVYLDSLVVNDVDFTNSQCVSLVTINGATNFCTGDSTTLDAGAGFEEYLWSTGDTTQTIVVNTAGTYTCTIRQGCCLPGIDSVTVTEDPLTNAGFTFVVNGFDATFANTSTGATGYSWDFGDGVTDTTANPSHTYTTNGTYLVCLTVSGTCGSDVFCDTVVITCALPAAGFSNNSGSLTVAFTDNSTGAPTSWSWDFGDGTTDTTQNPTHTYANPGTYIVCLTASNNCGFDTFCDTVVVTCAAPAAGFTNSSGSLTVAFTDGSTSVGSGITAWAWDFGDGGTSTLQNPTHVYANPGSYTVCLTVTDACGSGTFCNTVVVTCAAPTVAFTNTSGSLSVDFTDVSTSNSSGITGWSWTFGDGGTSSQQNPTHTYASPGIYTVCLEVTDVCGTNTLCDQVTVTCTAPVAGFTSNETELVVDFTDASTSSSGGVTAWAWDFGDGNSSTQQNPTHTYSSPGTYTVCLTVTDNCDTNTTCSQVTVTCTPPASAFSFTTSSLTLTFTDLSTGNPTAWNWDFGDGNTSTQQNPVHTYAADGNYTICLLSTNACDTNSSCQSTMVTGWEELSTLSGWDLYPNPNTGIFTLEGRFSEPIKVEISLVNMLGVRVMEIEAGSLSGDFKQEVDMTNFAAGVYYLRFASDKGTFIRKVVKQ